MTFQGCFLPSFDSFGKVVSEKKISSKSTNQKQELPLTAMFVNDQNLVGSQVGGFLTVLVI
jgi:hypothetical protein